jgi:hypothetical protein|uniref:Uncharacterized protein n=1 Tax=viral metagenome TaxID=1070528 RepID=A0A6C0LP04_9ZZZZ
MLKKPDFLFQLDFWFKFVLLISVMISFYVFIQILVVKDLTYKSMFSTWQFPMLLAIFIEVLYGM